MGVCLSCCQEIQGNYKKKGFAQFNLVFFISAEEIAETQRKKEKKRPRNANIGVPLERPYLFIGGPRFFLSRGVLRAASIFALRGLFFSFFLCVSAISSALIKKQD